jgi:hypothetical protein
LKANDPAREVFSGAGAAAVLLTTPLLSARFLVFMSSVTFRNPAQKRQGLVCLLFICEREKQILCHRQSRCFHLPVVTALPALISWKTADIPCLGCEDFGDLSALKRGAEGGAGGGGPLTAGALGVGAAAFGWTAGALPAGPQTGPRG